MQPNTDEPLEQAIATLNQIMALVHNAGFTDSAHLIAMAKMQMQLDLNGVTDRGVSRALRCGRGQDSRQAHRPRAAGSAAHPPRRRDGDHTPLVYLRGRPDGTSRRTPEVASPG